MPQGYPRTLPPLVPGAKGLFPAPTPWFSVAPPAAQPEPPPEDINALLPRVIPPSRGEQITLQGLRMIGDAANMRTDPETLAEYKRKLVAASRKPSQIDIEGAAQRADAARLARLQMLRSKIKTPQLEAPNYAPVDALTLPGTPQRQQVKMNPLAALGAAIAGIAAPQYAGQFGAAQIQGALKANQQQYEDAQLAFQDEVKRRIALQEDALRRSDDMQRADAVRRETTYRNSAEDTKRQMEDATISADQLSASLKGRSMETLAHDEQAAGEAGAEAQAVAQRIKSYDDYANRLLGVGGTLTTAGASISEREQGAQRLADYREEQQRIARDRLEEQKRFNLDISQRGALMTGTMYNPRTGEYTGLPLGAPGMSPVLTSRLSAADIQKALDEQKKVVNLPALQAAETEARTKNIKTSTAREYGRMEINQEEINTRTAQKAYDAAIAARIKFNTDHPWTERRQNKDLQAAMGQLITNENNAKARLGDARSRLGDAKYRYRQKTGIEPDVATGKAADTSAFRAIEIKSKAEYDALPAGTHYIYQGKPAVKGKK